MNLWIAHFVKQCNCFGSTQKSYDACTRDRILSVITRDSSSYVRMGTKTEQKERMDDAKFDFEAIEILI